MNDHDSDPPSSDDPHSAVGRDPSTGPHDPSMPAAPDSPPPDAENRGERRFTSDFESEAEAAADTNNQAGGALPDSDPVADLEAEMERWKDLALRTAADLDNLRKRTAREKDETRQYANARLLESLLPVIDNFEWGLQAARADAESSVIFQGMSMVLRQLEEFLASENIEVIDASGRPFDPNLHEAVGQQPSDEVPEGTVLSQSRKGYRLRDRLLRPAAVIVSSGPSSTAHPST